MPFCHVHLRGQRPLPPAYPRELNTLGDHLRKRRLDLGLLQKEVAEQLGVGKTSIFNWERNRTTPALWLIPKVIRFLGYTPYPPGGSLAERIRKYRKTNRLSLERR